MSSTTSTNPSLIAPLRLPLKTPSLRPNDETIGPLDAEYIAELPAHSRQDDPMMILTPNASFLPKVYLWESEVYLRKDGRFGWDDRTLWMQYYSYGFEYLCCIPRKPVDLSDPMQILWWTPQKRDFKVVQGNGVDIELGVIAPDRVAALKEWRDRLVGEVQAYQANNSRHHVLGLITTAMRHCFIRLTLGPFTWDHLVTELPEFQRFCLDIRAWLDYVLIFQPRLTEPEDMWSNRPVHHERMGAVTEDPAIVLQLHQMRLPVWRVVPLSSLPYNINIRFTAALSYPANMVEEPLNGRKQVIIRQVPGTIRFQSMQRIGCAFADKFFGPRRGPEPENGDIRPRSQENEPIRFAPYPTRGPRSSVTSSASVSTALPIAGSRGSWAFDVRHCKTTIPPSTPITVIPTSSFSNSSKQGPNTRHQPLQSPSNIIRTYTPIIIPSNSRNPFVDVDWDLLPISLPAWATALQNVRQMTSHVARQTLGYACPDPNMIAASINQRDAWLVSWLSRRDASYFYAISSDNLWVGERASLQAWKAVLAKRLARETSSVTSTSTKTGQAKRRARLNKDAADFFTNAGLPLGATPREVTWNHVQFASDSVLPSSVTTQVLWEMFENNFRLELLRMDCHLMKSEWETLELQVVREELVKSVFFGDSDNEEMKLGHPGGTYIVTHPTDLDMGLASPIWMHRRPFVSNLAFLMSTWPCVDSLGIPGPLDQLDETKYLSAEIKVAEIYCQTFMDTFGRAASLPHSIQSKRLRVYGPTLPFMHASS